jgi:anti-anti-sigma regulatory factor
MNASGSTSALHELDHVRHAVTVRVDGPRPDAVALADDLADVTADSGTDEVVVDLRAVSHIGPTTSAAVAGAARVLQRRGGSLHVLCAQGIDHPLLERLGVHDLPDGGPELGAWGTASSA